MDLIEVIFLVPSIVYNNVKQNNLFDFVHLKISVSNNKTQAKTNIGDE